MGRVEISTGSQIFDCFRFPIRRILAQDCRKSKRVSSSGRRFSISGWPEQLVGWWRWGLMPDWTLIFESGSGSRGWLACLRQKGKFLASVLWTWSPSYPRRNCANDETLIFSYYSLYPLMDESKDAGLFLVRPMHCKSYFLLADRDLYILVLL